jgi:predicted nucleic acid-binding protein
MARERRIAFTDHISAELLGAGYTGQRKQRLDDLLAACVRLPTNESTLVRFAEVAAKRSELKKGRNEGRDAGDNDVWIISAALEYQIPLFSHDRQQVELGRAMNLPVVTNIADLRLANPSEWRAAPPSGS